MKNQFSDALEAGVDEAGRGCLAGPVCVAAVILPHDLETPQNIIIRDSKKMSARQRSLALEWIKENAIAYSHQFVDVETIDRINILQATLWGMVKALENLDPQPEFIVIDGPHYKPSNNIPYKCVPQGDSLYRNVAAASIIAKQTRDAYMSELSLQFPDYGWDRNKAYGTLEHRVAIKKHGITCHHRRSFKYGI